MMAEAYIARLLDQARQSFFLLGPRGSGKSTWGHHVVRGAHRIDVLDQAIYHAYLAQPGQFADELRAVGPGTTVVVNEVQRIPALLNEVHRFMEERRKRFAAGVLNKDHVTRRVQWRI